jgi:hypothetical protein
LLCQIKKLMTAIPNKVTQGTTLAARVNKADKEANPVLAAVTRGTRVSKAAPAVAANKVSKEICQIAGVSKVRREGFLQIGTVLRLTKTHRAPKKVTLLTKAWVKKAIRAIANRCDNWCELAGSSGQFFL